MIIHNVFIVKSVNSNLIVLMKLKKNANHPKKRIKTKNTIIVMIIIIVIIVKDFIIQIIIHNLMRRVDTNRPVMRMKQINMMHHPIIILNLTMIVGTNCLIIMMIAMLDTNHLVIIVTAIV